MKKIIASLSLILLSVSYSNAEKTFIELLGHQKSIFKPREIVITVDYGQNMGNIWVAGRNAQMVDADGKTLKFNSMVDAMNYMGSLGWEFEQAYVVTIGQQNVYHWLLSKEVEEGKNASSDIHTFQEFRDKQNNGR